jgi:hypothetical protein
MPGAAQCELANPICGSATASASGSAQFEQLLLNELMNSQQGRYGLRGDDGREMETLSPEGVALHVKWCQLRPPHASERGQLSSIGDDQSMEIDEADALVLANALIQRFGRNGMLSREDVRAAYHLDELTVAASYVKAARRLVEADWDALSGGAHSIGPEELRRAIRDIASVRNS